MQNSDTVWIALIAPMSLLLFAGLCLVKLKNYSLSLEKAAIKVSLLGIFISIASAALVTIYGTLGLSLLEIQGVGFALRLDTLSVTIFSMISILGFVILKFSNHYLGGDSRKDIFFARIATTIAAVELLILSGNLLQIFVFWTITSICLHYLLIFYKNRPQAVAAARKKFIVARLGDISLLAAFVIIYLHLGTANLGDLFNALNLKVVFDTPLVFASILMVIAAALKSAQFPTHGWLIEVVETPTPVSALLHAGLLNAGPFLMVRMAYFMAESTTASLILIVLGGLTAMLASIIYLTQSTIKVSLGYSSIAHMGFSLLLCGIGAYPAAILHIVAHSFYKAHAFLSSGSAVDVSKIAKVPTQQGSKSIWRAIGSIVFATVAFVLLCYFWDIDLDQDFNLIAIGFIIIMGISQLMNTTLSSKTTWQTILATGSVGILVVGCFFTFEHSADLLLGNQVPSAPLASVTKIATLVLVACYAIVMLVQLFAFRFKNSGFTYVLGVYLRNGLYANVLFDRMIGSLKDEKFKWANLTVEEDPEVSKKPSDHPTVVLPEEELFISQ